MRLITLLLFFLSLNAWSSEKPGKTHLIPFHEVIIPNDYRTGSLITPNEYGIYIKNYYHDDIAYSLFVPYEHIQYLTIIEESPILRGKLLEVFDEEDRSMLTSLKLRIKLKVPVSLNNSTEKIQIKNIILSPGYELNSSGQYEIIRTDLSKINELNLPYIIKAFSSNEYAKYISTFQKDAYQHHLNLDKNEIKSYIHNLFSRIPRKYHHGKNNTSTFILGNLFKTLSRSRGISTFKLENTSIYRGDRNTSRIINLKIKKLTQSTYNTARVLKILNSKNSTYDWTANNLKYELCNYSQTSKFKECETNPLIFDKDSYFLEVEKNLLQISSFFRGRAQIKRSYIHKGESQIIDKLIKQYIINDYSIVHLSSSSNEKRDVYNCRFETQERLLRILTENNQYDEIRFLNEGGFYKDYPSQFFELIVNSMISFLRDHPNKYSSLTVDDLKKIDSIFNDSELDNFGNNAVSDIVNFLGQVFKKRKWVPYIRFMSMFRENHLTEYRQRVFDELFSNEGLQMGDIILEKDLQANTDVLIPGYWVHASIYLGTIKELKKRGIWEDQKFSIIRYEIEKYASSKDRQYYLNKVWNNKKEWEDIPWFYESDRPGVGVHPFIKFLHTDGMAVLRPSKDWNHDSIKDIIFRANERMYFPYDYIHNVRNKFYVSCSKVVLKIFDQITFPVSQSGPYVSVSPDQIGQPVSLDPNHPEDGELKLIMFLDAKEKGKRTFYHKDKSTYHVYQEYLKSTGTID